MNPIVRKSLGVLLGLVAAGLAIIRFITGFRKNATNWIFPILIMGILLLIFYSIFERSSNKND